ncbi:hypothetical protein LPJ75_004882, partial [Coemansia sp. RSA 2598]
PKKKDEWIANTQFLRQRLGNTKGGEAHSNRNSVSSTVARKRRSSVGDVHQMLSVRESATLLVPAVPAHSTPGRRQPVPSGLFAGSSHLQKPGRQSRRSTFTENPARGNGDDVQEPGVGDYLGVRSAMDKMMRSGGLQDEAAAHGEAGKSVVAADVMAGLDSFAPVTFDAGTLFRNQLLLDPSSGSASPSSPFYSTKGGALSPADYMSTFSDVRSKFNLTARNKHGAAAASAGNSNGSGNGNGNGAGGGEQPSGHRFLSKMRHAFGGGRHGSGAGGRRRSASNSEKGAKPVAARIVDPQPPRLDFDLGSSLLTPDSSLHKDDGVSAEKQQQQQQQQRRRADEPRLGKPGASGFAAAPAVSVANDSAYYLIDYINSADNDSRADVSGSYLPASYGSNRESSMTPAARRIVNKSTRLRQTQYDYKFGSQIFECLDKDLLLLKTDLFNGMDDGLDVSSMSEWMKSTSDTIGSITVKNPAAAKKTSSKKKQVDVTKAMAYTNAAINRIVAHNNKNRGNNLHAPAAAATAATGNSSQLSRQLMA